jgi:hypothetical protein
MVESVVVAVVVVVVARNRTCGGASLAAIPTTGLLARHEEAALHRSDLDKKRRLDSWEIMLVFLYELQYRVSRFEPQKGGIHSNLYGVVYMNDE